MMKTRIKMNFNLDEEATFLLGKLSAHRTDRREFRIKLMGFFSFVLSSARRSAGLLQGVVLLSGLRDDMKTLRQNQL